MPDDALSQDLSHTAPAFRRALYIVVALNVGYGGIGVVGGILAASQALKADTVDFFGDDLITFRPTGRRLETHLASAQQSSKASSSVPLVSAVPGTTVYRLFVRG